MDNLFFSFSLCVVPLMMIPSPGVDRSGEHVCSVRKSEASIWFLFNQHLHSWIWSGHSRTSHTSLSSQLTGTEHQIPGPTHCWWDGRNMEWRRWALSFSLYHYSQYIVYTILHTLYTHFCIHYTHISAYIVYIIVHTLYTQFCIYCIDNSEYIVFPNILNGNGTWKAMYWTRGQKSLGKIFQCNLEKYRSSLTLNNF